MSALHHISTFCQVSPDNPIVKVLLTLRSSEVEGILDGRPYRLCLTLGALAELESAFGDEDMLALATRFEKGRISARDAQRIIGAGLRGAGYDIQKILAVCRMMHSFTRKLRCF